MHPIVKLTLTALAGVACAACSGQPGASAPTASAPAASATVAPPPASAIPMQAPPASGSTAAPEPSTLTTRAPSLQVILQRPSFAKAFTDMDGAAALPAWVKTADRLQPSTRVEVGGHAMWLSHVCEASGCEGGQLFVLTDPAGQSMRGLLVTADGTPGATVRQLTWLGKPDAAAQAYLKSQASQG